MTQQQQQQRIEADIKIEALKLREMFPQHSLPLIERILRSNKGIVDSAISELLDAPPDITGQGNFTSPSHQNNNPPVQYPPFQPHFPLPQQQQYPQVQPPVQQQYLPPIQPQQPPIQPQQQPIQPQYQPSIQSQQQPIQQYPQKQQKHHHQKPAQQPPKPQSQQNGEKKVIQSHIFPLEFLRWPKDAETVRTEKDGKKVYINANQPQQAPNAAEITIDASVDGVPLNPNNRPINEWNEFKKIFA